MKYDYELARFVFSQWKHPEFRDTDNLIEVGGTCYVPPDFDEDSDDEAEIASLRGYYINYIRDKNLAYQMDVEADLCDFYGILFDKYGELRSVFNDGWFFSALVITKLFVEKEHRGQKIGSRLIKDLQDVVVRDSCILLLKPHPIKDSPEEEITKEEKKAVKSFYKKLGFAPIKDCMYKLIE